MAKKFTMILDIIQVWLKQLDKAPLTEIKTGVIIDGVMMLFMIFKVLIR